MLFYVILITAFAIMYGYALKARRLFFMIPIIMIMLEIGKSLSVNIMMLNGYNGFMFIIMSLFISHIFILNRKQIIPKSDHNHLFVILFILSVYLLLRVDFTSDNIYNMITRYGNFTIIMFMFYVGYHWVYTIQRLNLLNYYFFASIKLFLGITGVFSLLQLGPVAYQGGIVHGPDEFQLYYATLPLSLGLLLSVINKKEMNPFEINIKHLRIIITLCILIVALSLMRTTWVISLSGIIIFTIFVKKSKWSISLLSFMYLAIATMFVLVFKTNVYEVRESRFTGAFNYENEGRVLEIQLVDNLLGEKSQQRFGTGQLFNAKGRYGFKRQDRSLHGTFANIIYGSGYIGFILFVSYMLSIMLSFIRIRSSSRSINIMKVTGLTLATSQILAYFSANTTYGYGISYFVVSSVYTGALLRLISIKERH